MATRIILEPSDRVCECLEEDLLELDPTAAELDEYGGIAMAASILSHCHLCPVYSLSPPEHHGASTIATTRCDRM